MPCPPLPCFLINVIMKKPIKESVVLRAIQRPPGLLEAFFEIACPCPFVSTGARYHEKREWELHSGILGSVCAQRKLRCSRAVLIQLSSSSARGIGSPGLSSPSHAQIPESIDR